MKDEQLFKMKFSKVYPLYLQKVERKGRSKLELDEVICWLTGYDDAGLLLQMDNSLEDFFINSPQINPNAHQIKGVICGIRVENIEDSLMQKIRWLDKLVDELAKGKAMEKIIK